MRFWRVVIAPVGATPTTGLLASGARMWSSLFPNGQVDPGAPLIEIDALAAPFDTAMIGAFVRIWGVSIQDISQASDFNGQNLSLYGGMSPGLPLATQQASHAGLLAQGQCYQALGNWINENMTLDLIFAPVSATTKSPTVASPNPPPANIVFQWQAGTPIGPAISNTLKTAYPQYNPMVTVSPNLVLPNTETGFYRGLQAFAEYIRGISLMILNPNGSNTYRGVSIHTSAMNFMVADSTAAAPATGIKGAQATGPIQLMFNDLIGQPTWIEPGIIQVTAVMRSDLHIGSTFRFPTADQTGAAGAVTVLPNALAQFRQKSIFQGDFGVQRVRHVGNSRSPDAESWVTVIDAYSVPPPAANPTPKGNETFSNIVITPG